MPSSRNQGLLQIIAAVIITGGVTATGVQLYNLDSSGNIDKTETIEIGQPVLVNCTNTGGKANYSACYFQNPFTGTGVIRRLELHTEANPSNTPFDCGVVSSLTSSGTGVVDSGSSGSGSALARSPDDLELPPSWYVKCAAAKTPGTAFDAVMLTELTEYHAR